MAKRKPNTLRELRKFAREINGFLDRTMPNSRDIPRISLDLPEGYHIACCDKCGAPGILVHHCATGSYGAACLTCHTISQIETIDTLPEGEGRPN